jgi:hypothetical protein
MIFLEIYYTLKTLQISKEEDTTYPLRHIILDLEDKSFSERRQMEEMTKKDKDGMPLERRGRVGI